MKDKSALFSIRMPRRLKKAIAKQARKEDCHANQIACKALEQFLKKAHKKYEQRKK